MINAQSNLGAPNEGAEQIEISYSSIQDSLTKLHNANFPTVEAATKAMDHIFKQVETYNKNRIAKNRHIAEILLYKITLYIQGTPIELELTRLSSDYSNFSPDQHLNLAPKITLGPNVDPELIRAIIEYRRR